MGGAASAVTHTVTSVAKAVAAPVVLTKDIVTGKNVGQSFANFGNTEVKAAVSNATLGANIVNSTPGVGKVANAVTGNLFGSTTALGNDLNNVADGNSAGNIGQDTIGVVKGAAITGAEIYTAGAIGGALGVTSAFGAGQLTGKLLGGNLSAGDALSAVGDATGNPDLGTAGNLLDASGVGGFDSGGAAVGPTIASNPVGYATAVTPGGAHSSSPLIYFIPLAIAGAAFLILKKGRK